MVTNVVGDGGPTGRASPVGADDPSTTMEAEDVVRSGDVHVHGVESLCVGESQ